MKLPIESADRGLEICDVSRGRIRKIDKQEIDDGLERTTKDASYVDRRRYKFRRTMSVMTTTRSAPVKLYNF